MTCPVDALIREIQEASELTGETRNILHGCLSTHPWGQGKPAAERAQTARYVLTVGKVPAPLRQRLERLARMLPGGTCPASYGAALDRAHRAPSGVAAAIFERAMIDHGKTRADAAADYRARFGCDLGH